MSRAVTGTDERTGTRKGLAPMSLPAPQSKPVAVASRLVAQIALSVAFGPRLRILAAGPAPPLTVLRFALREQGNA
jgi:hypothetical protein